MCYQVNGETGGYPTINTFTEGDYGAIAGLGEGESTALSGSDYSSASKSDGNTTVYGSDGRSYDFSQDQIDGASRV